MPDRIRKVMTMDFRRLENNLIDNIREAHLKLGYDERPMSFNYTLDSLCHLLGSDMSMDGMEKALESFSAASGEVSGGMTFRRIKNGFCLTVTASGTAYVKSITTGEEFIAKLVEKIRSHTSSLEEVVDVFRDFSGGVITETPDSSEFDLLVRFPEGSVDEYYYCLSAEQEIDGHTHITYHRFIKEDYSSLFQKSAPIM